MFPNTLAERTGKRKNDSPDNENKPSKKMNTKCINEFFNNKNKSEISVSRNKVPPVKMNSTNQNEGKRVLNEVRTDCLKRKPPVLFNSFKAETKSEHIHCEIEGKTKEICKESFLSLSDVEWDDFDLEASKAQEEFSPKKETPEENFHKFKVLSVQRPTGSKCIELTLEHFNSPHPDCVKKCILKGFWIDTVLEVGNVVHVFSRFVNNCANIDDSNGLIVVNPDFLLSSTAIVSTLFCMRKAVLNQKFHSWESGNRIMLIGSLVHQLFQKAVSDHVVSVKEIQDISKQIIKRMDNLTAMYYQGITESEVASELHNFIESISQWINQYCKPKSIPQSELQITGVQDIEDNIWCTRYGIKGKIDLTVKVKNNNKNEQLMPLELKSGSPSFSAEHKGQVSLYTLMMEGRTHEKRDGLLLYLRGTPQMKQISSDHNIRRGLIQLRNELAHYTYKGNNSKANNSPLGNCYLPDPINKKNICEKCPYLLPCTMYQKVYNNSLENLPSAHAMKNLVPNSTSHVTENHLNYFHLWSYLLNLESNTASQTKAFWNQDAREREKEGLCFSDMELRSGISTQQEREGDVYVHSFFRSEQKNPLWNELASVGLKSGDYVVISGQENTLEVALATGYIVEVKDNCVTVSVERDIQVLTRYEGYLFRIDKQTQNSITGTSYMNLMKLMMNDDHSSKLREHIIDKKPAEFIATMSKRVAVAARPFLKALNKPQRKAVFKTLMANDFVLLKGMPGTGKTATIVALVRTLVQMGQKVLLTSYTHSAVDNILLNLLPHLDAFLRIGNLPRIHAKIQPYAFGNLVKNITKIDDISAMINSKMVIASTCLGITHPIFRKLKFDICIVDEASQIIQTACLGPMFLAKKFVLVGDSKQLPPVVINKEARVAGMQESMLTRLENPANSIDLVLQYRMNKEIMRLSNELTYNGKMECGSEEISTSVLDFPCLDIENYSHVKWMIETLDYSLEKSVVFLDTDNGPAAETMDKKNGITNYVESQIVCQLVHAMVKGGLNPNNIGVITPYRGQVELIIRSLKAMNYNGIEVNTVDQYQGRDKDAIIISSVKTRCSDDENLKSAIVADERRLNVALSRAKKKLILIGSKCNLIKYECYKKLFEILRQDQIVQMPRDAQNIFLNQSFSCIS